MMNKITNKTTIFYDCLSCGKSSDYFLQTSRKDIPKSESKWLKKVSKFRELNLKNVFIDWDGAYTNKCTCVRILMA